MNEELNLLNLDDSVFEIHEEIFHSENELFSLHTSLDDIMARNPQAKEDGVFRGRLAENCGGKGSTLHDFWTNFDQESKGKLQAQFLLTDSFQSNFAVEVRNLKIKPDMKGFAQAVRETDTFSDATSNCCVQILKCQGPQAATKHFYEALRSKTLVVQKRDALVQPQSKQRYIDRQIVVQRKDFDPETKCAIIENQMKSKTYAVGSVPVSDQTCQCKRCHLNRDIGAFQPEPTNVQRDGNGDNCSLYFNGIEETQAEFIYITTNFALSHLCHLSMLTDLDSYYPGISYPYVYIGGLHSFFPIHVEDMSLWSINYHHMGCPKLIVVVPPRDVLKLSLLLSHYGVSYIHRSCIFKLTHKSTLVFPQLLLHHGIKFKIIFQKPGDFIFFAPNAAHTGGNMGPNINEACNIGTVGWLPYGSVAAHNFCNCMDKAAHIDVTSLIMDHKKELISHHKSNTMDQLNDEFFQNSIVMANSTLRYGTELVTSCSSSQQPPHPSAPRKHLTAPAGEKKKPTSPTSFRMCPVEGCFKKYKNLTKENLERHIEREHPTQAKQKGVISALQLMFPERKVSRIQLPCPDCGKLLSVFSNKHRGTKACQKQTQSDGKL